jgi:hypothetical protein
MDHEIQWYSPAPFWQKHLENGSRDHLQTPALLQFERDDFMNDLQQTLEGSPGDLPKKQAEGEKHLGRDGTTESVEGPIPLYQPAHERYYLVTASLVCRERGLPDRAVDTTNEEKAAFVLRRLVPDASGSVDVDGTPHAEYRWVRTSAEQNGSSSGSGQNGSGQGAAEAQGKTGEWRRADDPLSVPTEEDRLSMFPQSYAPQSPVEQIKGKRRLWAGLIPVAKRDTFETAPVRRNGRPDPSEHGDSTSEGSRREPNKVPLFDRRRTGFETRVVQAFKNLRDSLYREDDSLERADVRDPLLFAWLDFWEFLQEHLPEVAAKIKANKSAVAADFTSKGDERVALLKALNASPNGPEIGSLGETAADILRSIADQSRLIASGQLEAVLSGSELPDLGPNETDKDDVLTDFLNAFLAPNRYQEDEERTLGANRPRLQKIVSAALAPLEEKTDDDLQPPRTDPVEGGTYVVRCLYERPKCPGPLRQAVSAPSSPFRMASFFDAEAPGRDINITMPGVSLKDFRDSSQSATMVFTTELSKQAGKIQKEASKGLGADTQPIDLGRICSLSIPIITICALVLLLVIVVVLNIVFWWLPFFKICFPLPSSDG